MLEALGITRDEAVAYTHLVGVPSATVADVAEVVDLDVDQAALAMTALETRGLVARSTTGHDTWVASPPAVALGALVVERQEELRAAEHELAALAERYRGSAGTRDLVDVVDVVRGPQSVAQRFAQLQQGATSEVLAFVRADVLVVPVDDNTAEDSAVERGVAYRVVVEQGALERPGFVDSLEVALRRGEQVRVSRTPLVRLVIADRELAMVPVGSAGDREVGALMLHPSGLLDAVVALFELHWDAAMPLALTSEGVEQEADDRPDQGELQVLALMVAGLTDRNIASQLGLSRRTVQRRVRTLLDRAGVETRLQLGHEAARRGWV